MDDIQKGVNPVFLRLFLFKYQTLVEEEERT